MCFADGGQKYNPLENVASPEDYDPDTQIACHRRAKDLGAAFSVINANTETLNIFRMTGVDKKMNIQEKQDSNSD